MDLLFSLIENRPDSPLRLYITDTRILDAFEHAEEFNWDSQPTRAEAAVVDCLDGKPVFVHDSQRALLEAALMQPEPVQISRGGPDGYIVSRFK